MNVTTRERTERVIVIELTDEEALELKRVLWAVTLPKSTHALWHHLVRLVPEGG